MDDAGSSISLVDIVFIPSLAQGWKINVIRIDIYPPTTMRPLSYTLISLLSSLASSTPLAPWQGPPKFLVSITARVPSDPSSKLLITNNKPIHSSRTYYLSNQGDGSATLSRDEAAQCSISIATELLCQTLHGMVAISTLSTEEAVPLKDNGGISHGFSVNGKKGLKWEAQQFTLSSNKHKEAEFAIYPQDGRMYLYARLGSPTRLHVVNPDMIDGSIRIVPLE